MKKLMTIISIFIIVGCSTVPDKKQFGSCEEMRESFGLSTHRLSGLEELGLNFEDILENWGAPDDFCLIYYNEYGYRPFDGEEKYLFKWEGVGINNKDVCISFNYIKKPKKQVSPNTTYYINDSDTNFVLILDRVQDIFCKKDVKELEVPTWWCETCLKHL